MNWHHPHTHRNIACLAALLAPLGGVLFVKATDGVGPRMSIASSTSPLATPIPADLPAPKPLTDAQRKSLAWIAAQSQSLMAQPIPSPMILAPAVVEESAFPTPNVQITPGPTPVPQLEIPTLRLTGFMISRDGRFASINHAFIREGQEVVPDWTLKVVDGSRRRVIVEHTSGATIELFSDLETTPR